MNEPNLDRFQEPVERKERPPVDEMSTYKEQEIERQIERLNNSEKGVSKL